VVLLVPNFFSAGAMRSELRCPSDPTEPPRHSWAVYHLKGTPAKLGLRGWYGAWPARTLI
jgi:hypothetical protein